MTDMTALAFDRRMDTVCELCADAPAYHYGGHVVLCPACLETTVRGAIDEGGLGMICGRLLRLGNGRHAICIEPAGFEHDHTF